MVAECTDVAAVAEDNTSLTSPAANEALFGYIAIAMGRIITTS